eukprot:gene33418-44746_t
MRRAIGCDAEHLCHDPVRQRLRRRRLSHQAAVRHHQHRVGEARGKAEIVGDHDHQHATIGDCAQIGHDIELAADRRVCLVGRSMHRMSAAARSVGLMSGLKEFISEKEAKHFPQDKILYLCTGSQGEARAALARIASGTHPHVNLGKGDHAIFSSRVIPGNEVPIRNLQNSLADRGVRLCTERDHPGIHVSGHPCRDELAQMYAWARPQIAVPTHGERRHLLEHAAFARDLQVPQTVRCERRAGVAAGDTDHIDRAEHRTHGVDQGLASVPGLDPVYGREQDRPGPCLQRLRRVEHDRVADIEAGGCILAEADAGPGLIQPHERSVFEEIGPGQGIEPRGIPGRGFQLKGAPGDDGGGRSLMAAVLARTVRFRTAS